MQEQFRVQKLVQDVQNVVNAYHTFQRLIPVADKTPSGTSLQRSVFFLLLKWQCSKFYSFGFFLLGVCTGMASVQNTNTDNKVQWQQSHKRKNSEAIDAPTIAKIPRGRPPGKKNQFKGIMVSDYIIKHTILFFEFNFYTFTLYAHSLRSKHAPISRDSIINRKFHSYTVTGSHQLINHRNTSWNSNQ